MANVTTYTFRVECDETAAEDFGTAKKLHKFPPTVSFPGQYASGTSANQADLCWSDSVTTTGAANNDIDLTGSLTTLVSGSVNFVNIVGFAVHNRADNAAGETLTIGAGSNPWITWLAATGDAVVIDRGGYFIWVSPEGAAVTAGTGDILRIAASAAMTYDVLIWGQSA